MAALSAAQSPFPKAPSGSSSQCGILYGMAGRRSHSGPDIGRLLGSATSPEADPAVVAADVTTDPTGEAQQTARPWAQVQPHASTAPYAPDRLTVRARVSGHAMQAFDVTDGDDLILVRRPVAEHGDLAVLPLGAVRFPYGAPAQRAWRHASPDTLTLWKVYPESGRLRLSAGGDSAGGGSAGGGEDAHGSGPITAPLDAPIHGVVVGVLRRRPG